MAVLLYHSLLGQRRKEHSVWGMNHSIGPESVGQQRYESCCAEQARLRMIKIAQFRTIPKIELSKSTETTREKPSLDSFLHIHIQAQELCMVKIE
jgi:hypothetical protein